MAGAAPSLSLSSFPKSPTLIPQLHAHLLTRNILLPSPFLTTKLIQLYADSDLLPSALSLLPSPNIFSSTAIISAFSRAGHVTHALRHYRLMRSAAVYPDGYVIPVVLRAAAADGGDLGNVGAVHGEAVKFGVEGVGNVYVGNGLVVGYCGCGEVKSARKVFDGMRKRDVVSWNSMVNGYVSAGRVGSAVELVRAMKSNGCDPDTITWNTLMDGYCRTGQSDAALEIFHRIPHPDVISWTTIILAYSRSANHEAALSLFRKMLNESAIRPDQDTLSCALSSCRHLSALRTARELHAYGLKTVPAPAFYLPAGVALLATYAGCKRIAAIRVFRLMDPTDVVTWNALLVGLTHAGDNKAAQDHFRDMQSRGVGNDPTTLATVLPACNLRLGREVHAHVIRNYYESTTTVFNALIAMYSRSGCISAARSVFSAMSLRDVVSYNSMIYAYGSNGFGEPAVQLVGEMNGDGIRPNGVTLTSVLAACSHSGLVDAGLDLFNWFKRVAGLDLEMGHYACLVDLLGRAGPGDLWRRSGLLEGCQFGPIGAFGGL